ncbi:unnamed protein product [Bursaphelenchus xylophilus]|uniref:(pine wood nematode) hypothetical protein n=1 Tax=Bursaphelenchus xylophilus TaxID=6326 RepID=A0A1I7RV57_BURXY|nr:unnamed protein product [Bursaphelenchus xylophilus]CAG9105078.1 unnamed protein product [Bursaphelenchus xylophilus]
MQIFSESLLKSQPTRNEPGPSTSSALQSENNSAQCNGKGTPKSAETPRLFKKKKNGEVFSKSASLSTSSKAPEYITLGDSPVKNQKNGEKPLNGTKKRKLPETAGDRVPTCSTNCTPSTSTAISTSFLSSSMPNNTSSQSTVSHSQSSSKRVDVSQDPEGSILSPMEATQGMLKMVHGISVAREVPVRPAFPVFRSRFDTDVTPISPNGRKLAAEAAKRAGASIRVRLDDLNPASKISLFDNENENKLPLSVTDEKRDKKGLAKDPKTGLTMETVKRRDLCQRFEKMLNSEMGFTYRVNQLPQLTNIQLAGLMRRSRNRNEFSEMSDEVWCQVFEEKRRYEDRSHEYDNVMTRDFVKKLQVMQVDDRSEKTDSEPELEEEEFDEEDGFPVFEEIQNVEEETKGSHEMLTNMYRYFETRRHLLEEEKWLQIQIKKMTEKHELLKASGILNQEPHLVFGRPAITLDPSERCARCLPLVAYKKRPIIRMPASKDDEHNIKTMNNYTDINCDLVEEHLQKLSNGLEHEPTGFTLPFEDTRRQKPRRLGVKTDEKVLARARERYHAKRALFRLTGETKKTVGRPRKPHEYKALKSPKPSPMVLKKKMSQVERKEEGPKKLSMLMNPVLALEIERETRQLEEKLSRVSHNYNYQEITIPSFRPFDEKNELEKLNERSSRRSSIDEKALNVEKEEEIEPNEALWFAKIHHLIEYPRLSETEIKRRKKDKVTLVPEHRPFIPELYAHENPLSHCLKVSVNNVDPAPFPARFPPALRVENCTVVHEEPVIVDLNKQERSRKSLRAIRKDGRSRSNSVMDEDSRSRSFFADKDELHIDMNLIHSLSNSPLMTPNTESNTPSPLDMSALHALMESRRRNTIPSTAQCTFPAAQRSSRLTSDPFMSSEPNISSDLGQKSEKSAKSPKIFEKSALKSVEKLDAEEEKCGLHGCPSDPNLEVDMFKVPITPEQALPHPPRPLPQPPI